MAQKAWSGRGKTGCGRQVLGDAGDSLQSVSRSKIPRLHCTFIPQYILCYATLQGETSSKNAQEIKAAARAKVKDAVAALKEMKLKEAAKIERLNREICRRTRVVGAFSDGNSTLMLFVLTCVMLSLHSGATKST